MHSASPRFRVSSHLGVLFHTAWLITLAPTLAFSAIRHSTVCEAYFLAFENRFSAESTDAALTSLEESGRAIKKRGNLASRTELKVASAIEEIVAQYNATDEQKPSVIAYEIRGENAIAEYLKQLAGKAALLQSVKDYAANQHYYGGFRLIKDTLINLGDKEALDRIKKDYLENKKHLSSFGLISDLLLTVPVVTVASLAMYANHHGVDVSHVAGKAAPSLALVGGVLTFRTYQIGKNILSTDFFFERRLNKLSTVALAEPELDYWDYDSTSAEFSASQSKQLSALAGMQIRGSIVLQADRFFTYTRDGQPLLTVVARWHQVK